LLFSTLVLILVVEFFITGAALCYGIITSPPQRGGEISSLAFPWVGWAASALIAPVVILGLARIVTGDAPETASAADAWSGRLPPRAKKLYDFFRNAPVFVFSLAFIALGVTLLLIDGAFALVKGVALALVPYLPHFLGALTVVAVALTGFLAWYRVKNNQLSAEYAFRRDVMEKTGIVLLDDKGNALLPPAGDRSGYTVIQLGGSEVRALPPALQQAPDDEDRADDDARPQG
jgi:hypothetical protein